MARNGKQRPIASRSLDKGGEDSRIAADFRPNEFGGGNGSQNGISRPLPLGIVVGIAPRSWAVSLLDVKFRFIANGEGCEVLSPYRSDIGGLAGRHRWIIGNQADTPCHLPLNAVCKGKNRLHKRLGDDRILLEHEAVPFGTHWLISPV